MFTSILLCLQITSLCSKRDVIEKYADGSLVDYHKKMRENVNEKCFIHQHKLSFLQRMNEVSELLNVIVFSG